MSPTGHLAAGFAAKAADVKLPLWTFLASAYALDLLYFLFVALRLESMSFAPWSHSLLMAIIWSAASGIIAFAASRRPRAGLVIGLTVFSHWVLDFIVWKHNPIAFDPSRTAGLGLFDVIGFNFQNAGFNRASFIATVIELTMLAAGIIVYIMTKRAGKIKAALTK